MTIQGLTDEQVIDARNRKGTNRISKQKTEGFYKKLVQNFKDPMVQILCVALIINFVFAVLGETEWYEAVGIAIAIIIAVLVSTLSEHRNETAFQRLQEEASKAVCKVYRNGALMEVSVDDVVVGDWVLLQLGDKIPADGVLRKGIVQVDQSTLNGESEEIEKIASSEEFQMDTVDLLQPNQLYSGCLICGGEGVMEVVKVGDASLYGQLAKELQTEQRDSPLKVKLKQLAKTISVFGYTGGVVIALAYMFQKAVVEQNFDSVAIAHYFQSGMPILSDLLSALMFAVIIIVMAVPEGLPLMIAIVSAQNMGNMLKDQVLVRKITGIETAGSLNVLLTDKTGTLTKGQLEMTAFIDGSVENYDTYDKIPDALKTLFSLNACYNTSASITKETDSELRILGGNATERAMLEFMKDSERCTQTTVLSNIPFDSKNKYSIAQVSRNGKKMSLLKGAPEKILSHCNKYYNINGETLNFGTAEHEKFDHKMDELAHKAMRLLVLAVSEENGSCEKIEDSTWALVGVVAIRDEVRPEAVEAITYVHRAGIQVVMITGDRKETARAIAEETGIISDVEHVILTSDELAQLSDEQIKEMLPQLRVIARALPSDKHRLVQLAQEEDLVVGMTGDGVNDAPALKKADVGFAMGSGTEVAKEAGDIVILDDNFSSVGQAILYGRTIYTSIRKFIIFQLTINVSAVLVSFMAPLLGMPQPLTITQILWINLVMDTMAAMAFGGEPALIRYMNDKPRRRDESIISSTMKWAILVDSLWITFISYVFLQTSFVAEGFRTDAEGRYLLTGFFAAFVFMAMFNAFNARTESWNLLEYIKDNPAFPRVMATIFVVQILLVQFGGSVFRCYGLNLREWVLVIISSMLIIPVDLFRKNLFNFKSI